MNPSPIPKFDNPKLHQSECLYLFGAGREKKIYAIPPHTYVVSLAFDDVPFERENFRGKKCRLCGSTNTYLDEMFDADEVLVTSSSKLCMYAIELDGKPVGGKAPELLEKIRKEIMDEFMPATN